MRRRALLTTGSALLASVAGCLSGLRSESPLAGSDAAARLPTARLSMAPIEDADIPGKILYSVPTEYESGEQPPEAALIERAAREGSATIERTREPLPTDRPVAYDDTVYRLDHEVTAETPATRFSVKIDIVTGDEPPGRTVQFADLPAVDRAVFERRGFHEGEVVGIGTTLLYTDPQVEQSALVPETDVVVIEWANGNRAEWVVDDSYDTTLSTYRYTVEETTPASEFGRRVRERVGWELSGLSAAERDIVESATEDDGQGHGHYVVGPDETPPEAMVSLVERFRPHDRVEEEQSEYRNPLSGPYLVDYDGTTYWANLGVYRPPFTSPTPT
jgi:hypothetical protein